MILSIPSRVSDLSASLKDTGYFTLTIELGLQDVNDTDTLEGLVNFFGVKSQELKKIIFFELYGMIMADSKIEEKEAALIEMIEAAFGLPKSQYADIIAVADDLRKVYDHIYEVLF